MSTVPVFSVYPSRSDSPDTFADDGDQFVSEIPAFIAGINTVAGEVNMNAAAAATSKDDADTAATLAQDWATKTSGEVVSGQGYGAKKYADDAAASATAAAGSATTASGYASTALNAPGTSGTSTTSLTIGAGSKSLTTQTGKLWVPGQPVMIARTSDPTNKYMGAITATYDSATGAWTGTVPTGWAIGSGTYTDWTISLAPAPLSSIPWSLLTGKPTTIAGYGITDSGIILLSSATVSSATASVDFTSGITSTYSEYELHLINVMPSSGDIATVVHSTDGGASWESSYSLSSTRTTGSTSVGDGGAYSAIALCGSGGVVATAGRGGVNGTLRIYNPAGSSRKIFGFNMICETAGGAEVSVGGARNTNTAALNAIRFAFASNNIASGEFKLYGVRK